MKYFKIIILVLFLFIICSCKSKEEYSLIELTSEELVNNLFALEEKDFILAAVNEDKDNYEQFLRDLGNFTKSAKINVYYINYYHMDKDSSFYLSNINGVDFQDNSYYTYEDKNFTVAEYYTDFGTMYGKLKNFKSQGTIEKVSEEKKEEYIEEAKNLYDEGNISNSFDKLNRAWDLDKAKSIYQKNKYYKLLISWECFNFKDKEMKDLTYYNLVFYHGVDFFNIAKKDALYDKTFDKNFDYDQYEQLFYYVKDDIIFTKKDENNKFKKMYQITLLDNNRLDLLDIVNNKSYSFVRRT